MTDRYYTVEEFAKLTKMNTRTILNAIKSGRIHAVRFGSGKKSPFRIPDSQLVRLGSLTYEEVTNN